jgi:hypothetical protein
MATDPRPKFTRLDGRLESFDPDHCIHEVIKTFQRTWHKGEVELARLELPDHRIIEQRNSTYVGLKGAEYSEWIHTEYREINAPKLSAKQAKVASAKDESPPQTFGDLARIVRRDRPRQGMAARLFELMDRNEAVDFDTLKDEVHQADVDDDAVEKMIKNARKLIKTYHLAASLTVSDRRVSRRYTAK